MRTHVIHGLAATVAVVLAACSNTYPQQPKDPINADPKPQQAINDPKPQPRGPTLAIGDEPQQPINDPSPQESTFGQPSSPGAITQHDPQKPFYGPGLVPPDERDAALEKAKTKPLASDGEVLSFVMAVSDEEVQMAEMAKKSAEHADVKSFAVMMSQQHTKGMQKVRNLQSKSKIQLQETDLTLKVKNDASQSMSMLRDKKGKEFDRLYIDTQVRMHKEVLESLDNRVIPAISNGEIKSTVSEMRRQISDHLTKAEGIQKKLDPSLAKAREEGGQEIGTTTTTSGEVDAKSDSAKAKAKAKAKTDEAKKDTKDAAKDAKKGAKDAKDEVKDEAKDAEHDIKH